MVARNDITKARIVSKPAQVTADEWDRIFGKRKQEMEKTMASLKVGPKGTVMKVTKKKKNETYSLATSTKGLSTKDTLKYGPKIREQAAKKKKRK